ncbi:hypothetical protein C8A01DRAFT_35591 [Parachaetomium inaequale]|uniref:Sulfotransferase domain-containing protein n=1 Tax=Parachaetomium inaequale TaxID=2588326 RepID=A0AAN6PGI6_9PEZI|nr:hypothetical protein C8A01DRAFT_35591 [Parachaetomium inaequale]
MTEDIAPTQSRRIWLITSPRTASNMLVKILNLEAQGVRPAYHGGYFFLLAGLERWCVHSIKAMNEWTEEEHKVVAEGQQKAFDALQDYVSAAEKEGQRVFVKEHAIMLNDPYFEAEYTYGAAAVAGRHPDPLIARGVDTPTRSALNLTSLPDEFLKTWSPTFLIRHPAMMFPSLYRTCLAEIVVNGRQPRPGKEPLPAETTMRWHKTLYDFYRAHFGADSAWPVVLDADDIMTQPALVAKYAGLAGLDPAKLVFEWDRVPEDKLKQMTQDQQVMLGSILASSKVDVSKVAGDIDIAAEAVKWRAEFGEEGGANLERWVREAMPDYLAMHSRRLRLD